MAVGRTHPSAGALRHQACVGAVHAALQAIQAETGAIAALMCRRDTTGREVRDWLWRRQRQAAAEVLVLGSKVPNGTVNTEPLWVDVHAVAYNRRVDKLWALTRASDIGACTQSLRGGGEGLPEKRHGEAVCNAGDGHRNGAGVDGGTTRHLRCINEQTSS